MLIFGSTNPLPIEKYPSWFEDEGNSTYVISLGKPDCPDSKALFATRDLYSVAACHTGDGCGFSGSYPEAVRAREELASVVEDFLRRTEDLQLYVAHHDFGTTGEFPRRLEEMGPSDIRSWMDNFYCGKFYQMVREEESGGLSEGIITLDESQEFWTPELTKPFIPSRNRAYRRRQWRRAKARARRLLRWLVFDEDEQVNEDKVVRFAVDRVPCSCYMCGNPRRYDGEVTRQEIATALPPMSQFLERA